MGRKTVLNRITSAEKTAKINKNNLRLLDDFLIYLKSIRRSPGTINGYANDLLIVFTYILEQAKNKDFQKITKRDLIGLQNWLLSNGNSSARVRRIKSAISSLSNYCENILADDDPDFNGYKSIVRKVENPPLQTVRDKTVWQDEDVEKMLEQLTALGQHKKACFVALAAYGGRRKSEICRFKVSDFDESHLVCDGALYKSEPMETKGGKQLECYTLAKKFQPYLDAWMQSRKQNNIESEWLFPNTNDPSQIVSISTVNSWANSISILTGRDFYFHSLRHYFVSALSRAGIPDGVLVQIVGWANADMVAVYNDNSKDDQISKYFQNGEIVAPAAASFQDL